ncbi:MAG: F0F1 ATP synthase subunit delta [Alphaproteobacteria bacterium]|nr:F0F1 ATP synthase subunit delta [Alphaproteobacteria bacterium]OJV15755.1 MAG: hypothetical protein BGO27_07560 [Alphaproteobacteria bacterium 33-17]
MSNSLINLYAKSLVEVIEGGNLSKFKDELQVLTKVLCEMKADIRACHFDRALQKKFIASINAAKAFRIEIINFLKLLAQNSRLVLAEKIIIQAISIINQKLKIKEMTILSSYELDSKTKSELESKLSKSLGFELHVTYEVDEKVLGGIKIIVDNKEYDATILGKINAFRHSVFSKIEQIK